MGQRQEGLCGLPASDVPKSNQTASSSFSESLYLRGINGTNSKWHTRCPPWAYTHACTALYRTVLSGLRAIAPSDSWTRPS